MTEQTKKRLAEGKGLGGAPSLYKKEYCFLMIEFFSTPLFRQVLVKCTTKALRKGFEKPEVIEEFEEKGNVLPTFVQFARNIGVTNKCLLGWIEKHEEFGIAHNECKELQKNHLMQNGIMGNYNAAFGIFTAKNITDMRDQPAVVVDNSKHVHYNIDLSKLTKEQKAELAIGRKSVRDFQYT